MRYRIWTTANNAVNTEYWRADYKLVQEVLNGAEEQWVQLYETAYQTVLGCARQTDWQKLLLPQDYEDIADEAFARCYAQLERYRDVSRFSTWVSGYARNITRNRCSRQQTRLRNERHLEELAKNQMVNCDPLLILLRCERDRCLWQAFFDLDEVDQEIVIRRVFENDPPRDIARELKLTRKEVLHRFDCAKTTMQCLFLHYYNHVQQ